MDDAERKQPIEQPGAKNLSSPLKIFYCSVGGTIVLFAVAISDRWFWLLANGVIVIACVAIVKVAGHFSRRNSSSEPQDIPTSESNLPRNRGLFGVRPSIWFTGALAVFCAWVASNGLHGFAESIVKHASR
jgi:hypothetical protein